MKVTALDRPEDLRTLEAAWKDIYRQDTEATVFLSWEWMWGRLRALDDRWFVLVASSTRNAQPVGILALRRTTNPEGGAGLTLAGSPLADRTGFLLAPGFESAALEAFAGYLSRSADWEKLTLRDVGDARLDTFLEHCRPQAEPAAETTTPCPRVPLPGSWEEYLAGLSASTRETVRRKLRGIEGLPGFRVTTIQAGRKQLDTLIALWRMRWGALDEQRLAEHRSVFEACLEAGRLWIDVLWDGDTPITGLLALLDEKNRSFCFYVTGFDAQYARLSPGTAIVAHSIRAAIALGYEVFDFLRGDERYKSSFGAENVWTRNVELVRTPVPELAQ